MWIDTHCHLTHAKFSDDLDAAVARARAAGLSRAMTIGTGIEDAKHCLELSRRFDGWLACSAGLDPFTAHELGDRFDSALAELAKLLSGGEFSALGEVGLDYHYDLDSKPVQESKFRRQLELAEERDLPVVIHVREAHEDLASILAKHPHARGVIHSFTGGPGDAEPYLALGWLLSFNGVATFKNAEAVREAFREAPRERLLLETDAPYLAPVPFRGKRCEPAHTAATGEFLAELIGVEPTELARITSANARGLFGWSSEGAS